VLSWILTGLTGPSLMISTIFLSFLAHRYDADF
jgi:hypothetical protein